ncbi:MAG: peptidylprolyl isomerase [Patescibacteria group bacterium]|nr:peptidylprolyl isomerase [Patescibacteria group bacterium]
MRINHLMTVSLAALALLGAGCAQGNQTAIAPQNMNQESALARPPESYGNAAAEPQVVVEPSTPPSTPAEPSDETAKPPRPTSFPGILPTSELKGKTVRIATTKGDIVFELLPAEGPRAASNFYALARSGFYDGLTFHRVEPGFVIQGGDPKGNGTGGPGYKFEDDKVTLDYKAGIVAMANSGPNTNGSQFFIMLEDNLTLPKNYSVFGRVVSGMDVVRRISVGDVMTKVTVETAK